MGCKQVMWRFFKPGDPRNIIPTSNSVFNSAVVPLKMDMPAFRCDDTNRRMRPSVGFSKDAIHWGYQRDQT